MTLFLVMVFEKTLGEIVDENYVYARALHYLGISFFKDQHKSLGDVCLQKGLDFEKVIKSFYDFENSKKLSYKELDSQPVDLLLGYLRHAHHLFIKEKLPFITHVARNCDSAEFKELFIEFIEDFIFHIYEEEDTVFKYVSILSNIKKGKIANPMKELIPFRNFSLKDEFDHHQGDDEMKAIRTLIEGITPVTLQEQVLVKEVKAFDREMFYHAEIENKIFFPKAIALEKKVNKQLKLISTLN